MKNTMKVLGIIAIVALIGFSMVACGSGGNNTGGNNSDGNNSGGEVRKYEDFEGQWVASYGGSYTFSSNTYIYREGSSMWVRGTFTFTNTQITQTPEDPATPSQFAGVFNYELSGNQLTIYKADGKMSGVFIKQ